MLVQEVSLTTTKMIGEEIMKTNNSEAIHDISSTVFLPHKYYNNLECPTLWCSQRLDSKHV